MCNNEGPISKNWGPGVWVTWHSLVLANPFSCPRLKNENSVKVSEHMFGTFQKRTITNVFPSTIKAISETHLRKRDTRLHQNLYNHDVNLVGTIISIHATDQILLEIFTA